MLSQNVNNIVDKSSRKEVITSDRTFMKNFKDNESIFRSIISTQIIVALILDPTYLIPSFTFVKL